MTIQYQYRRDTSANWTANNTTLAVGEPGYEIDTGRLKIGTGSTPWNSLAYTSVNPAGSNTNVIFNGSGSFAANASFSFNQATTTLTIGNSSVNTSMSNTGIAINGVAVPSIVTMLTYNLAF